MRPPAAEALSKAADLLHDRAGERAFLMA